MKTSNQSTIWNSNEDLLSAESCLPEIGSCQVSSILQNLDSNEKTINANLTLTEFNADIPKLPSNHIQTDYVVLQKNGTQDKEKKMKNNDNFEDMLYFVCNLCPFLCTSNEKITEHLENAHKNKIVRRLLDLKCPACPNVFFHKMSLRSHLIHDHGVGNSDLSKIIQAVVYYANNNKKANSKSFNKTPTSKPNNANLFESKADVLIDIALEQPDDPAMIEQGKMYLPKVEFNENKTEKLFNTMMGQIQSKIVTKKFNRCKIFGCKAQFQEAKNMHYHETCHKDAGFECPACNEGFTFWKSLASHLWLAHKIDMELHCCDKCDYKTISLYKLNNIHKLTHSDVRAFVCNVCMKAFKNVKQLSNHKNTHKTQERAKIACQMCSKTFCEKRQLKVHIEGVHEKLKPYLCNYCGYKGSTRSSLKMHIRQHTGEKPFACDSCSYTSSDHNSLRRHKLRHSGQKPYKCSYCSYACIQSSTYKVHLKTKHPGLEKDLMFTCQECQFRTVNKDIYLTHLITVHKQKPSTS